MKILIILLSLLVVSPVLGECHRVSYSSVPVYRTHQVKEVAIVFPLLIPAFQFQYQSPIALLPQVPTRYPIPATTGYPIPTPQGYLPSGNSPVSQNNNDKIKELAKALLEEMHKQADDGLPVAMTNVSFSAKSEVKSNIQEIARTAVYAMSKNCAACHTGVGAKGEMILFNQPGLVNVDASWGSIKREVESGRMPPKQSQFRLTFEESEAIKKYAELMKKN